MENARFQSRSLNLVAKVRSRGLDGSTQVGYVERTGLARIKRKDGKVEVFFPERESRGYHFFERRIFLANFMEVLGRVERKRTPLEIITSGRGVRE